MNKYNAKKTRCGLNHIHDSKREAKRCNELQILLRARQIHMLEIQPILEFQIEGRKIFSYRPDFAYFENGRRVYEDSKGFRTPVYRLKKKIIEATYHVEIRET